MSIFCRTKIRKKDSGNIEKGDKHQPVDGDTVGIRDDTLVLGSLLDEMVGLHEMDL